MTEIFLIAALVFLLCEQNLMSLARSLAPLVRANIPEAALAMCKPEDKPIVENIIYILLEIFPLLNVSLIHALDSKNGVYRLMLPFSERCHVHFTQLQSLYNNNPSRIQDIICMEDPQHKQCILLEICDETHRSKVVEYEIQRIRKRVRFEG